MAAMNTVIFSVLFGIVGVANVLGNALIMAVIAQNKSMRTPVNYLLLSLAVPDMLVGITSIVSRVVLPYVSPHPQGIVGDALCILVTSDNLLWICGYTSATILAVIAYERYQVVVHPYTAAEKITNRRMMLAVVVCWVLNAAVIFQLFLIVRIDHKTGICSFDLIKATRFIVMMKYVDVVAFVVRLSMMIILYSRVVWVMVKQTDQVLDGQQLAVTRQRKRVTTMLVVVTIAYIVTIAPVSFVLLNVNSLSFIGTEKYEVKVLMFCLNSALNAFIYALFSVKFRQGFKSIIGCSSLTENQTATNDSNGHHRSDHKVDTKL